MQSFSTFDDWQLLLVTYNEPFSVADLMTAATSIGGYGRLRRGVLIDIRNVSIASLSGADSRRFADLRKDRMAGHRAEPAAFLMRSMEEFPYLRMHNQWVDALGLRSEADTLITTEAFEALEWLERRTDQPGLADALAKQIPS